MICPVCFGRKYDFKKDGNSGYFVECKKCHGTGIVESQTNEEWFCGLSTEEKAKTIVCLEVNALHKWKKGLVESDVAEIKRWLKEIHK